MIKNAMAEAGLSAMAAFGLVMFVLVFAGVVAWALTRRRGEIDRWSTLPLADGAEPLEPRHVEAKPRTNVTLSIISGEGPGAAEQQEKRGCGKCEHCTC